MQKHSNSRCHEQHAVRAGEGGEGGGGSSLTPPCYRWGRRICFLAWCSETLPETIIDFRFVVRTRFGFILYVAVGGGGRRRAREWRDQARRPGGHRSRRRGDWFSQKPSSPTPRVGTSAYNGKQQQQQRQKIAAIILLYPALCSSTSI